MKNHLLLLTFNLVMMLLLSACKKDSGALGSFTFNRPGGAPVRATTGTGMSLVSPASSPAFVAAPTILVTGVVSGERVQIYSDSSCSDLVGAKVASGTSVSLTLSALSAGTYSLYTKSSNTYDTSACSGVMLVYQYLGIAPKTATGMTLVSPGSSPSADATPSVMLTGLLNGETAYLYIDSSCSEEYGSSLVTGTSATITSLPLAPGVHLFYTNSSNSLGKGACSPALLSYEYTGVMPSTAASLSLYSPTSSPNYDATPTLLASGVANGDTVNVYSDAGCTTLVGQGLSKTTTTQVTLNALAVGAYSFYTNSTNVIGTSPCSALMESYTYSGPPPLVEVSWSANNEKAVNRAGGGYRVYYSTSSNFDIATASYVDVPYVSGPLAPVSVVMTNLLKGPTFFKVVAYSALNAPGSVSGSQSQPSAEFTVTLP